MPRGILFAFFVLLAGGFASSVKSAEIEAGYVIKTSQNRQVYLDPGKAAPERGQTFRIFTEGPKLIHPVTGEVLGMEEKTVAEGRVLEIREKYIIGEIDGSPNAGIQPAQRVRFLKPAAPPVADPKTASDGSELRKPAWKSPQIDGAAVSIAVSDLTGDGSPEILVAEDRSLSIFRKEDANLVTMARHKFPAGENVHYLDVDRSGNGAPRILLTVYHPFYKRASTRVLVFENGALKEKTEERMMLRTLAKGTRVIGQSLEPESLTGLGVIRPQSFEGGGFSKNGKALRYPRLDWLYGFELADFDEDGTEDLVFCRENSKIRIQFSLKNFFDTDSGFCQSRNRIRWKDVNRHFTPRLIARNTAGKKPAVLAINNTASKGSLAAAFGKFGRGELTKFEWDGLALETSWKARLSGYGADLTLAEIPGYGETLVTAVVGSNRKTSLWLFPKP